MGVTEGLATKKARVSQHGSRVGGQAHLGQTSFSEPQFNQISIAHLHRKAGLYWPQAAMTAAVDQKALDVRALDISEHSDIADYFIICSGTSERHTKGIADKLQVDLAKYGERPISVTGYTEGQWIVIDYGDLIAHIFYEPLRQHYGLDELWASRSVEVEPPEQIQAHMRMLKTGIIW